MRDMEKYYHHLNHIMEMNQLSDEELQSLLPDWDPAAFCLLLYIFINWGGPSEDWTFYIWFHTSLTFYILTFFLLVSFVYKMVEHVKGFRVSSAVLSTTIGHWQWTDRHHFVLRLWHFPNPISFFNGNVHGWFLSSLIQRALAELSLIIDIHEPWTVITSCSDPWMLKRSSTFTKVLLISLPVHKS